MRDNIYSMQPINKTTALASSQSGCEEEESLEYRRDTLARALQRNQAEISALPKKHRYKKELGLKNFALQQEIIIVNKKLKLKNLQDKVILK